MKETWVGSRELKNHLRQYLQRVSAGEAVIITQHGRPVAKIVPIQSDLSCRLQMLVEEGVVKWNGQMLSPYRPKVVNTSGHLLSDLIVKEME